jgi:hypothetical protein
MYVYNIYLKENKRKKMSEESEIRRWQSRASSLKKSNFIGINNKNYAKLFFYSFIFGKKTL